MLTFRSAKLEISVVRYSQYKISGIPRVRVCTKTRGIRARKYSAYHSARNGVNSITSASSPVMAQCQTSKYEDIYSYQSVLYLPKFAILTSSYPVPVLADTVTTYSSKRSRCSMLKERIAEEGSAVKAIFRAACKSFSFDSTSH